MHDPVAKHYPRKNVDTADSSGNEDTVACIRGKQQQQ